MRILIVDDHEVAREGLRAALERDADREVVGEAATAGEALQVAVLTHPTVAVVDHHLPGDTGDALCRALRRAVAGLRVVVLSSYLNEEIVRRSFDAGADAYVTKAAGLAELRRALTEIEEGTDGSGWRSASQVVARLDSVAAARAHGAVATPHQVRVLELLSEGLTYGQIAESLHISVSTVRFHLQNLKIRLGARSRSDLIAGAIRSGLIARPADEAGTW
jgi:DNA-binding NarL/FixJ family response regulator